MAVAAVKEYQFAPADSVDKFHGNQLLYIGWEDHLLFCAPFAFPFPPAMRFGDIIAGVLPGVFGYHPDFAQIDWSKVEWFKSGQPWQHAWGSQMPARRAASRIVWSSSTSIVWPIGSMVSS